MAHLGRRTLKKLGIVRYHGKVCATCGGTERLTTNASCVVCHQAKSKEWLKGNHRRYADKRREHSKKHYQENREAYYVIRKAWRDANPGKVRAATAKYRAAKLRATPKWLSPEEMSAIQRFYEATPKGFHVDHVIPLQGKIVSGLHVLDNLQYLEIRENLSKRNSYEPLT